MHNCLSKVPIFRHLNPEDMDYIQQFIRPKSFQKGESVLLAGHYTPELLILNRGNIKVFRTTDDGNQQIIRQLAPGDYLGDTAVFAAQAAEYDAIALEDSSFCSLSKSHLHQILEQHPDISIKLLADMSQRLEIAETQLESLGQKSAEQRLLEALRVYSAGQTSFRLPINKKDLASQIGVRPETLSRLLKRLQVNRLIQIDRKIITILSK